MVSISLRAMRPTGCRSSRPPPRPRPGSPRWAGSAGFRPAARSARPARPATRPVVAALRGPRSGLGGASAAAHPAFFPACCRCLPPDECGPSRSLARRPAPHRPAPSLLLPAGFQRGQPLPFVGQRFGGGLLALAVSMPMAFSRPMILRVRFPAPRCGAAVVHLGRRGMQAHRHAGAGGVEQAHRLVGQLARRDVAVRQLDRGLQRLVQDLHLVVLSPSVLATPRIIRMAFPRSARPPGHLEAAGQRRVFLDVLLVLGEGGGADGAQLCRAPAPA
jgi:hypothetical protein